MAALSPVRASGAEPGIGRLLREWRRRRRLTQLELALDAGISTRHSSFVETGRSKPAREMVVRARRAARDPVSRPQPAPARGWASRRPIGSYALGRARPGAGRAALERVLDGHEPYPAVVVDRSWNLVAANSAIGGARHGRGIDPAAARAARQRPAVDAAPARDRAADPQPRRVARAPARAAAPPGRSVSGELTCSPVVALRAPRGRAAGGARRDRRRATSCAAAAAPGRFRAAALQHDLDLRHGGRDHPAELVDRGLLSRRPRDGPGTRRRLSARRRPKEPAE